MQLSTDNPQSTIITLHDAITDSPVYRSTTTHFDDQVDLLEKWLDLLSKNMKQYTDKLNKFNLETNILCKKVIPVGIDDFMIDSNFTGGVIKSFSDALQTSLAFKTKLVSDLEDNFIQPLQSFIKTHLKEFKDFRRQHEKTLEKYEAQLLKYTSQSKTKEASAVREEAFRLYEARKAYVHISGQHVVRILHFRSLVEHFLVERFSLATASHLKEYEGESKSWSKLQSNLISWKQWLLDDQQTCNYQLNQLQKTRIVLENKFIASCRPVRDLEKYNINSTQVSISNRHSGILLGNETTSSYKWGYLYVRGSRNNWYRRWFFLYDGCFGSCIVNPNSKYKGSITVNDRVSVLLCDIKPMTDIDRRNCFEVMCPHQPSFALQAETEVEMNEWIAAFEKSKRLMLQTEDFGTKSNSTASTPEESLSNVNEIPVKSLSIKSNPSIKVDDITTSALTNPPTHGSNDTTLQSEKKNQQSTKPSIVMLSSASENDPVSLAQSASLTPLLVWEASRAQSEQNMPLSTPSSPIVQTFPTALSLDASLNQNNTSDDTSNQNNVNTSSWGIPWALVPSMFHVGNHEDSPINELTQSLASSNIPAITDSEGHQVVWPTRIDDFNLPKVEITGYHSSLDARNKELRSLFGGVDTSEVVLFDFVGLLKKKPSTEGNNTKEPASPTLTADTFEQELSSKLFNVEEPTSNYGYSYTGHGFVTQDTFWFYSCVLMHCVNTIAIRLGDIKNVRIIRDSSIPNTGSSSNLVLAIDLVNHQTSEAQRNPLIITTLMEDIEVIAEKLKFAIENAKNKEPESLQTTYDVINSLSAAVNKNKSSNQPKTIIKSATDPIRSTSDISSTSTLLDPNTILATPIPSKSTDTKKKSAPKAPRKYSAPIQPKSGALAAAMMAASVAGGTGFLDARKGIQQQQEEARQLLRSKKSKASLQQHQEDDEVPPIPLPNSTISSASSSIISKSVDGDSLEKSNNPHAVPAGFNVPSGPVSCGCDNHLDKLESEIEVPVSAKHLYYMLFDEANPNYIDIWERKTAENKSKDLSMTSWQMASGNKERTLKYIIPVNNPMVKLKEAEVVEKQIIEKKEDYLRYVVLTSTKTAQLPYADAFVPSVKYCITWISHDRCKLSCYTGVKFLKNILVKGMVSKAAMKGMSENIAVFMPIVKDETHKQSGKASKDSSVSLKRAGTIKQASSSINDNEKESNKEKDGVASGWYGEVEKYVEIIQDLVSTIPFAIKIGATIFILLLFMFTWIRSGSKQKTLKQPIQEQTQPIVSRAVYLRDIDEGLIHVNLHPSYRQSESFIAFMETKSPNRTLSTNYKWFSSHHHQFAIELLFSRERLAMLRHDTLVLFQLVNEVDTQLFENEYLNWLMDTRLKCRVTDVDYDNLHCDDVKRQLKGLSMGVGNTPL